MRYERTWVAIKDSYSDSQTALLIGPDRALVIFCSCNFIPAQLILYQCGFSNYLTDINECSSSPCHPDADCTNTNPFYNCKCKNGYAGDGMTCTGEQTAMILFAYFLRLLAGITYLQYTHQWINEGIARSLALSFQILMNARVTFIIAIHKQRVRTTKDILTARAARAGREMVYLALVCAVASLLPHCQTVMHSSTPSSTSLVV